MEIQDIQYILGANPEVEEEEELKEDTAIIKYFRSIAEWSRKLIEINCSIIHTPWILSKVLPYYGTLETWYMLITRLWTRTKNIWNDNKSMFLNAGRPYTLYLFLL